MMDRKQVFQFQSKVAEYKITYGNFILEKPLNNLLSSGQLYLEVSRFISGCGVEGFTQTSLDGICPYNLGTP